MQMTDEQIAQQMRRVGIRVERAAQISAARVWVVEMIALFGVLAGFLFLYVSF